MHTVSPGAVLAVGAPVVAIESEGQKLEALIYIPAERGKNVKVGMPVRSLYPWSPFEGSFVAAEEALASSPDLVFASLPHTQSMQLLGPWEGGYAVDLGGDFRLRDAGVYREWFGTEHTQPQPPRA